MWFERFVIIVTSLHRDYLPSSWAYFSPTMYDIGDYIFSFGLFFTFFFLFAKFLPVINMAEVKAVLKSSGEKSSEGYGKTVHGVASTASVAAAHSPNKSE